MNRPAISFVGGLHPRKGVADLITAFEMVSGRIPRAFLYLIGEDPYRALIKNWPLRQGLAKEFSFAGSRSTRAPICLDPISLCLPLMPNLEPWYLRNATSVDGNPEMLDGGKAGVLVPPRRSDLLADAITKVLNDKTLLADMRTRSRLNLDHFTGGHEFKLHEATGDKSKPCARHNVGMNDSGDIDDTVE